MPYADPLRERERQRRRLAAGHGAAYLEAAAWADAQIETLKAGGVRHSAEEWRALRHELAKSRLNAPTRLGLSLPPLPS